MTRASVRFGIAFGVLYAAVAVATAAWGPGPLRPLFDGFASHPGAYSWVKPPKEFAEGNRPPEPGQARVAFSATGSSAATADTADGQATASAPAGAIPPQGSDGAATIDLRPVDPTTLGALPAGLRAEGNAYQVSITYLPSKAQAQRLTAPGVVGVLSEAPSTTLLHSADGQAWRSIEGRPVAGGKGFTAPLTDLGYYLAAGQGEPRPFESSGGVPVALLVVAAVVPLLLGGLLLSRRRAAGTGRPAAARPAAPKGQRKGQGKGSTGSPPALLKPKAGGPSKPRAKDDPPTAGTKSPPPPKGGSTKAKKQKRR